MVNGKQKISILPLALGVFLVLLVIGPTGARSARPAALGEINDFKIALADNAERAEAGDNYWVTLDVNNPGSAGEMWVQCSILDEQNDAFIVDVRRAGIEEILPTVDNCEVNEPYTQTVRLRLNATESDQATFTMTVPPFNPSYLYDIYCVAYEQCYYTDTTSDPRIVQGSFESDALIRSVQVVAADNNPDNNNEPPVNNDYPCTLNKDCPGYIWGSVVCDGGFCIDSKDVASTCGDGVCEGSENPVTCKDDCTKFTDFKIKEFIADHKIAIIGIALVLVIIGAFGIRPTNP